MVALLYLACPAFLHAASHAEAERLWQQGQAAVERGDLEEAERLYRASLTADPGLVRNHLGLASLCIGRDDLPLACTHLAHYLDACPEQRLVRLRYADLLTRVHSLTDAHAQFERVVADTQDQAGFTPQPLVHCHRRLMEIAEARKDVYTEHLHRGVGLYLVARARAQLPRWEGALAVEGLLFKAAAELSLAQAARVGEARPCWYLYEVWNLLGQHQAAQCWLRAADAAAPYTYLTLAERRRLHLACQARAWESTAGWRN